MTIEPIPGISAEEKSTPFTVSYAIKDIFLIIII